VRYDGVAQRILVSTYTPSGGWTVRGTPLDLALAPGDRLGARARGDGSVEVWRNTNLLATYSVGGWPFAANGGRIGVSLDNASAARLDDFGGGNSAGGVTNSQPLAVASATPASGRSPLSVDFSGAGSSDPDGDALQYAWTFGDGASANSATVSHVYGSPGEYTARLTVSDGRGGSSTAAVAVSVTASAPAFPTTAVLDAFDRPDGAVGGNWVGEMQDLTLLGQQLMPIASAAAVWNGASFGVNQEAYVTLAAINPDAAEHALMLKVQGLSWDTGCILVRYEAAQSRVSVSTYAPAQGWVTRATFSGALAAGDRLGARALSNGNVQVYRNTTRLGTGSVSDWPFVANGGWVGLKFAGADGARLDNFGGGEFTAGPPDTGSTAAPSQVELSGGIPNPTTAGVQLSLALPRASYVGFAIYDLAGRQVWAQDLRALPVGRVTLVWNGRTRDGISVPAGAYLARVSIDGRVLLRRLAVLR
ncbi:MAG: PKD domain-containing protein, partial [Candidatus Eisenbacteria bacterium]